MRPKTNIRKITKFAKGSMGIVIPADELRSLGWKERQRVLVKRIPRGIVVRDAITNYKTKHQKKKK